jgi:cytochrome c biogenesis protein CcdA
VLRLIGIVISIAAVDAVNPSTLVPALYIASGPRAFGQVLRFAVGVVAVYLSAGLVLTLGPGELILDLVPHPTPALEDCLQVAAGTLLLIASLLVWRFRARLAARSAGDADSNPGAQPRRPSLLLGAGIAAAGLPANVAYLGAIATIVGSGRDIGSQVALIGVYVAIFGLPLAGILGVLALAPRRSAALLGGLRRFIQQRWVPALVAVLGLAGAVVLALGVTGLAGA